MLISFALLFIGEIFLIPEASCHISIELEDHAAIAHHLHLRDAKELPVPAGGQISGHRQGHPTDEQYNEKEQPALN
jgi:hypothetical protein